MNGYLTNNLSGCLAAMQDINDETLPALVQLREAIARRKRGLSLWQRIRVWHDGGPPFTVDPQISLGWIDIGDAAGDQSVKATQPAAT